MSVFRRLAGETAAYGLSSVIGRLLNYLLVPLYTSVFLPGEYGVVTELYAYVAFLNILYIYGLETSYFRFSNEDSETDYYSVAFLSILVSSLLLSGIIFTFSDRLAAALHYADQAYLIRWLAGILAIDAIVAIPFARLRKERKAVRFASFKLINILLNIGLNLFFLVLCPTFISSNPESILRNYYNPDLKVGYVFLANFIANASYLIFLLPTIRKVAFHFDSHAWKRMLNYSWPILIIGFAGVTNEMLSRAILKYRLPEGFYEGYSNLEALGIFGACYKLAVFMTLAVQAFRYSFEPFFFRQVKEKNSVEVFSKVMTAFTLFTSVAWVSISLLLPLIAPWFLRQSGYLEALYTIPWLLGGGVFLGIFYNLSIWYKLRAKTFYGALISIVGALLTFLLNWILIPKVGYLGSAIATPVVYLTMVVISYLWGKSIYPIPYDVRRILAYLLVAGLVIVLDQCYSSDLLFSSILLAIYLFLLFLTNRKHISALLK